MPYFPGWKGDGSGGVRTMCQVYRDSEGGRLMLKAGGGDCVSSAYS